MCVFSLVSCKSVRLSDINLYSTSEDIKLGNQVKSQIDADQKEYPKLNNTQLKAYLQDIVNQILQSKQIKYRGKFFYTVEVINRDDVVNAFCTPGGYIYVYTGLIKFVDNEATLAGVLAHEIAHAERRHSTARMTQSKGLEAIAGLYKDKSKNTATASNALLNLTLLSNSRTDENEADEMGFKYLQGSKWYPGAIKLFFDKFISEYGKGGNNFDKLLSTHPLPKDRIERVTEMIKKANLNPPTEDNLFYRKYQEMKKTLLKN